MDSEVADAIGRGVEQVVLLGAGYDGRALRFGGGPARWFEVDRPETQADKRRRLDSLGADPDGVTYVGADPRAEPVGVSLDAAGHDALQPSLFVCEELFDHMTLEAAVNLCGSLRDRAPEGSTLAATFLVVPPVDAHGTRHARCARPPTERRHRDAEERLSRGRPGETDGGHRVRAWCAPRHRRWPGGARIFSPWPANRRPL